MQAASKHNDCVVFEGFTEDLEQQRSVTSTTFSGGHHTKILSPAYIVKLMQSFLVFRSDASTRQND